MSPAVWATDLSSLPSGANFCDSPWQLSMGCSGSHCLETWSLFTIATVTPTPQLAAAPRRFLFEIQRGLASTRSRPRQLQDASL